ncbi:MAG TPA: HAD-IC family P-type ATPase, partial [Candidatus Nanoarchaeia archaeon]|nr:HAD-IC family P-type ATPase [Candidatus Nanoarchaeia archaeon]
MEVYQREKEEVIRQLASSQSGLSSADASSRLARYGFNELQKKKEHKVLKILLGQVKSAVVYVLLAALAVSLLLQEWVDSAVIAAIIILNTLLGFFQEYKADKAIEKLRLLSSPMCRVLRDGREQLMETRKIVPGDVIILEEGAKIPADSYLLESWNLKVDESLMTGESVPVKKQAAVLARQGPVSAQENMVFASTTVTYGRAKALVVATAMQTELGKIAHLIQDAEEKETPLQKKLDKLGKKLALITVIAIAIIFAAGILRGQPVPGMFLIA